MDETALQSVGKPSRSRAWLWLVLLALASGGGYYAYQRYLPPSEAAVPVTAPQAKGGRPGGVGAPIPVVAVPARTGDLDVYLSGLGTAIPLRTVTVKSRVDGQLMRVHFEEGQVVKEGQLLAEIDPRPYDAQLKQAEGQLARDQALLANARLDVERYRTLLGQDSIAKQQVDSQEALVHQYEGVVRIDQGQLDNARLQLTYARITAPVSGRTGLRLVDPGNIVRAGDAGGLVVIAQLAPITVLYTLPQDNLPSVLKRQQAGGAVPVEAWDRDLKTKLATGTLAAVDNQVDTTTGTVKLKANFANADTALFPNQFVNVRMKLDTLTDVTVIPAAAIQRGAQSLFVYVVKDENRVTARPVVLGPVDGPRVAVSEGLAPGEMVVIDGIDRLREGATVQLAQRPEYKPSVDGARPAKKGGGRRDKGGDKTGAKSGEQAAANMAAPSPEERRARWAGMTPEEKKAAWSGLSDEQKARVLEGRAKREAEGKAGK
ncbi:MAG: MdtA/MuxA family multidrug efflux RND transporter periplasmic adaptor subunit [Betaproteobacteria bacterium]|nr:MdtA/MuxA family multidrug efflux RND transporter periplasmic adaptor subunit [Betaproteobacteria bacterium]